MFSQEMETMSLSFHKDITENSELCFCHEIARYRFFRPMPTIYSVFLSAEKVCVLQLTDTLGPAHCMIDNQKCTKRGLLYSTHAQRMGMFSTLSLSMWKDDGYYSEIT
jgi:hypothetical protein